MTITDRRERYLVRLASSEEIASLGEIERVAGELFRSTKYSFVADAETTDAAWLLAQQQKDLVWVVVDDEAKPRGFAVAGVVADSAHLHELSVDPDHGRSGLGTRLVEAVCVWARESGYSSVTLSTFRDVSWNAPFYRRLGFEIMTVLSPELEALRSKERDSGLPVDERVFMRLAL